MSETVLIDIENRFLTVSKNQVRLKRNTACITNNLLTTNINQFINRPPVL